MTLNNVDRVATIDLNVLRDRYIRSGRPVVFTALFDNAPIRHVATARDARALLGDLPLAVQPNYVTALVRNGRTADVRTMTLGNYLDLVSSYPSVDDFCVEFPTPERIRALLVVPEFAGTGTDDLVSHMFLANQGNYAHLHYDGDHRDVLMYQVFGRKRYVIVPVDQTWKLNPQPDAQMSRTSGLMLQNFPEDELVDFLRWVRAWDCVLEPGEALFIPMMTWHYVAYLDTSLSVNLRLPRTEASRALAEATPIQTLDVQALARAVHDDPRPHQGWLRRLKETPAVYADPIARAEALSRLCFAVREEVLGLDPPRTLDELRRREGLATLRIEGNTIGRSSEPAASSASPQVTPESLIRLATGVRVLLTPGSDTGEPLCIARGNALEAELSAPEHARWVARLLLRLGTAQTQVSVAGVAGDLDVTPQAVAAALGPLSARGWVEITTPASLG